MELEKSIEEKIALIGLTIGAIEISMENPFLENGYYNPIRYNNDEFLFYKDTRKSIASGFYETIKTVYKNRTNLLIAGTPSGISWATIIAEILNAHLIINVEDIKKDLSGSKVILIQDTITDESISEIDVIRKAGGICDLCLSVIDFGFPDISRKIKGKIPYEKDKFYRPIPSKILLSPCEAKSLITLPLLLKVATENHFIKNGMRETILEWAENRQNWGKEHGFPPPIKRA